MDFGKVFQKVAVTRKVVSGKKVIVKNGDVFIDGKLIDGLEDQKQIEIIVEGNCDSIESDMNVTVKGDAGSIRAEMNVYVAGNSGDVGAGMKVEVNGDINGNVNAGMTVKCRNVSGEISSAI